MKFDPAVYSWETLGADALVPSLFDGFVRHQVVTKCLRRGADGAWVARDVPFLEDWGEKDFAELCGFLRNTLATGGTVIACRSNENGVPCLAGFASVEGTRIGARAQYAQLSDLHVSAPYRGQGLGHALFLAACDAARALGVEKLYISSHSAVETQAFYEAMGCVDAAEPDARLCAAEPCDRQLEFTL